MALVETEKPKFARTREVFDRSVRHERAIEIPEGEDAAAVADDLLYLRTKDGRIACYDLKVHP